MIISTKKGTPKEELEKIVDKFEKQGLDVTLITGKDYNVFGLVGDTTKIDERDVLANPWIDNVTRVSAPCARTAWCCSSTGRWQRWLWAATVRFLPAPRRCAPWKPSVARCTLPPQTR